MFIESARRLAGSPLSLFLVLMIQAPLSAAAPESLPAEASEAAAGTPAGSSPAVLRIQVRDSRGRPWKNREVRLLSQDGAVLATANADAAGIADFPGLGAGRYVIELRNANAPALQKDVDFDGVAGATVSLATDAKPESTAAVSGQQIAPITVTGVKTPTQPGALREDVIMTESIDSLEMQKTGATSLTDALTHRPGIDVQVECSVCNVRSITLDNLPGRYTTLTLDGVPIFSPVSNAYGLDMLGVNGLERVDISRGAGTSLATPESLAGTINLVSKVPTQDVAEADLSSGDFGYQREALYGAKVFDWGAISISGTNQSHDSVDGVGYRISQFTGYHRDLEGFGLFANDLGGFKIKSRFDHIEEKRGGGPLGDDYSAILASTTGNPFNFSAGPNGSPNPNTWVDPSTGQLLPPYNLGAAGLAQIIFTDRNQFVGVADRDLGGVKLHFGLGYAKHEQDSWYGDDSDYWDHQHMGYADANLRGSIGAALVTAGVNFKFEDLHSSSISTSPGTLYYGILRYNVDAYLYRTEGAYLQGYEAFFDERLEVNASLREDHNNEFNDIVTPRLNALWHHTDKLASRLAMGTGYRLPTSFFEQDHGILSDEYVDRTHAAPERSINYSYSLNYADDRTTVTGSLNHTRINDMALFVDQFSFNNNSAAFVLEPAQHPFNVSNADILGTWKVTPGDALTLGLEGYIYSFNPEDAYFAALFSRPAYRASLSYDHDVGPWDFNIRSTFTGPQNLQKWYDYADNPIYNLNGTPKPNTSPTFWVADMHTSYQFDNHISTYIGVNNIFNYQQAKHDSYLFTNAQGDINVTYVWGPNLGRSFNAGVILRL